MHCAFVSAGVGGGVASFEMTADSWQQTLDSIPVLIVNSQSSDKSSTEQKKLKLFLLDKPFRSFKKIHNILIFQILKM